MRPYAVPLSGSVARRDFTHACMVTGLHGGFCLCENLIRMWECREQLSGKDARGRLRRLGELDGLL